MELTDQKSRRDQIIPEPPHKYRRFFFVSYSIKQSSYLLHKGNCSVSLLKAFVTSFMFFGKAQTALAVSADAAVCLLFSDRDKALFCQHRILLRAAVTEQSPAHAQIIGSRQIQFSGDDAFAAAVGFCDQFAAGIRDKR